MATSIKALSWKPRRRGATYCSPACGAGCTREAYDQAWAAGRLLAKRLGPGWRGQVSENMKWYFCAISSCSRLTVFKHGDHYTAYLNTAGRGGGRWTGDSVRSPALAVRRAVAAARAEMADIASIVEGL